MTPARLDATFAALADPTRRAILARLASGEASVTQLAKPFAMSQQAISKHLKVLERAGLIWRGMDAQRRPRKIEAKALAEANAWLERYRECWEEAFQRLDALLYELQAQGNSFDDYPPGESQVSMVLVEKAGKTTMTATVLYASQEVQDALIKSGMQAGAGESYDKLAELLAGRAGAHAGV